MNSGSGPEQGGDAANARSYCWWSSPESRAAGKLSVLAVVETVLSVAAFWWIAVAFDTYLHLVTSILIAPLVLLRSEASIKLGVEMFDRYWDDDGETLKKTTVGLIVLFAAAGSGLAAWLLAENWLVGHAGFALFLGAMVLGWLTFNIGVSVGVAMAMDGLGAIAGAGTGVVAATLSAVATGEGVASQTVAIAGVLAVPALAIMLVRVGVGFGSGALTISAAGAALGLFVRALLVRFLATATHLMAGIRAFSTNWQNLTTRTDIFLPPELIPGLPEYHKLGISNFFAKWELGVFDKVIVTIFAPIFYLPSLAYRYSLKSTAWLYLPLIYIAHLPENLRDTEGRRVWVGYAGRTALDYTRVGLALVALVVAGLAAIDWQELAALRGTAAELHAPLTALGFFLVLDWSAFEPWHWFSLPAAILTIALFFRLDNLRKREEAGDTLDYQHWTMRGTLTLNRIKIVLVIGWIAFAFYGVFEITHATCKLPPWSAPFLDRLLGPAACGG